MQMCAMVALVAPKELRISRLRVTRFLDSYIGMLYRVPLEAAKRLIDCCRTFDAFTVARVCCVPT